MLYKMNKMTDTKLQNHITKQNKNSLCQVQHFNIAQFRKFGFPSYIQVYNYF